MTALTMHHLSAGHHTGSSFTFFEKIVNVVTHELAVRKAIRELNSCSSEQLRDLGLTRSEIETAVRMGR